MEKLIAKDDSEMVPLCGQVLVERALQDCNAGEIVRLILEIEEPGRRTRRSDLDVALANALEALPDVKLAEVAGQSSQSGKKLGNAILDAVEHQELAKLAGQKLARNMLTASPAVSKTAELARLARWELARKALRKCPAQQLAGFAGGNRNELAIISSKYFTLTESLTDPDYVKLAEVDTLAKGATLKQLANIFLEEVAKPKQVGKPEEDKATQEHRSVIALVREHLAKTAIKYDDQILAKLAREQLIELALQDSGQDDPKLAREKLAVLYFIPTAFLKEDAPMDSDELARLAVAKIIDPVSKAPDDVVNRMIYGNLDTKGLASLEERFFWVAILPKAEFVFLLAVVIWVSCWFTVDVNLTSIHGLYRDRLASAFLVGEDTEGDVDVEEDIDLDEICRYDARSTAPYHLVNVALNLQGSKDIGVRDRNSDFFSFSKKYIGGDRTGYCQSDNMEEIFPQMKLSTAMAVSAAAASPNMGRGTSPALVAFMTLLNIRLGYWVPNPGLVEEKRNRPRWKQRRKLAAANKETPGFGFAEVFEGELQEIKQRWSQAYPGRSVRRMDETAQVPTARHGLVGIGYSGGGIRSATINLGISQVLQKRGVFDHFDYMSTVSGGGYLGSSISTLMRSRTKLTSEVDGTIDVAETDSEKIVTISGGRQGQTREYRFSNFAVLAVENGQNVGVGTKLIAQRGIGIHSEVAGTVKVDVGSNEEQIVHVSANPSEDVREYRFSKFERLVVKTGDAVKVGQSLIMRHNSISERFRWRIRPSAFLREMRSQLDEKYAWVNLSDGGRIENLATIELLRRRCKFVLIGDGEADPNLHFNGLATLIRTASIDLGIEIEINLDALRLRACADSDDEGDVSTNHWAVGRITYPELDENGDNETGHLLYFKSSFTGDEGEVIREYRHRNPDFPHESTADQMFDEGQFEAYRALGQHIGEQVLRHAPARTADEQKTPKRRTTKKTASGAAAATVESQPPSDTVSYADFESWFEALEQSQAETIKSLDADRPA